VTGYRAGGEFSVDDRRRADPRWREAKPERRACEIRLLAERAARHRLDGQLCERLDWP